MADAAPFKVYAAPAVTKPPRPRGRPKRPTTIADLAPLPMGLQTRNPTRDMLPKLRPVAMLEKDH